MDFSLSDTQLSVKASIVEFARNELNRDLINNDKKAHFPRDSWEKCAAMGLMALPIPSKYGGADGDLLTTIISVEALGYGCCDSGLVHALVTQVLCGLQICAFGNERQKENYLPKICTGQQIYAQAMTEPDAGSDVLAMRTRADKSAHGYVLNGTKMFISNGPIADMVLVFAVTNQKKNKVGSISCFIVEKETEGLERCKALDKMGLRTLQNGELVFDDCLVVHDNLLGKEGQGLFMFNEALQVERILLFACHLGAMERILETSVKYAKQRSQFGRTIEKFQSISNKIADMKVNIELGKLILYKAAWLKDQGERANLETSIAKLFVSESLKKACLDAVQIHGGYGYMTEFGIERDLRNSIASTIYSGTSEIQRNIISSLTGL